MLDMMLAILTEWSAKQLYGIATADFIEKRPKRHSSGLTKMFYAALILARIEEPELIAGLANLRR